MNIKNIDFSSPLYSSALDIWNQVWPDYSISLEERKHFDKNYDPKYLLQRFVVLHKSLVIGTGLYGEPWWSYLPGKLYFEINILQKYRNKGFGSNCFKYIENILIKTNGKKLHTNAKEDMPEGVQFLQNRGFSLVLREPESILDVQDFAFSNLKNAEKRIKSEGISIKSISELQKVDSDWKSKYYNLYIQIMKDVPNNDPNTERTFENFKKQKLQAPGFYPDAHFIAINNGKYIGLSSLWIQADKPQEYWTDLTGVLRNYRRKGVAIALKIHTIKYVKEAGGISIKTDNEEKNPMFGINKLLGFVPLPAWLTFEKRYS